MVAKRKDEEEEVVLELEEEPEEEKESKKEEAEEPEKEVVEEAQEEDDEDDESSEEEGSATSKEEESLEAKRERRRREKRMRREKQRRKDAMRDAEIARLQQELRQMKEATGSFVQKSELGAIESERKEIINVYNTAQKVMEAAITEGDGKKFAEAKAISDKAFSRYNFLEAQKAKYVEEETETAREEEKAPDIVGEQGKRYGLAWVKKNSSWYDPKGGNLDSKIALAIDTDLYNEGYDPNTKEYWDEFDDRCRERLPHRYKSEKSGNEKPKQTVGGGSRDSNPASYKSITVPKEFLQSLKAAGYEKGSAKYNSAVKHYLAQKKGA